MLWAAGINSGGGTLAGVPDRERHLVKKFLGWVALLAVLYIIATDPDSATRLINNVIDLIGEILRGGREVLDGVREQ